jgi:hypothetical protein
MTKFSLQGLKCCETEVAITQHVAGQQCCSQSGSVFWNLDFNRTPLYVHIYLNTYIQNYNLYQAFQGVTPA